MAIGLLPSWLNVQPAQFQQAYESGARQGLSLSELRDRMAAREQQRQLALEEMQARQAEHAATLEERQKEHEEEGVLSREKLASSERIATDRQGALDDWRNAQLDLKDAGLKLQTGNLELAKEKADRAVESGDWRAKNAQISLQAMLDRLELTQKAQEETARHNKASEANAFDPRKERYRQLLAGKTGGTNAPVAGAATTEPARPQTQAEYNALPSGAPYYDAQGNIRRKK